jgi:pimeloyl-ACP methyl ester carboxylesterase
MAEPRDQFVDAQGLPIHYLEWGERGRQPLILVHGYLDLAYSWNRFACALQQRQSEPLWIIAPDCRGHGDSGWVGAGGYYHFPDYVFDLDSVVRALGLTRFGLVGHSMGGTISFLYAGTFPERIVNLVLIEGVGPPGMDFADAPAKMARWIEDVHERGRRHFREYTSIDAGADQLRQTNPRLKKTLAVELARHAMKRQQNGKWIWKFDPLHRTTAPQPFYTEQALEFFRRIACPVLIVEGAESHQTRRSDKQPRYDAIRDCRRAPIAAAGHMVHHDQPDRLAEVVSDFLFR